MPLRTADDYRAALVDGRSLYYQGVAVADINQVPDLRVAVDHAALDYELAEDPRHRDLAVAVDADTGEPSTPPTTRSPARPTTSSTGAG